MHLFESHSFEYKRTFIPRCARPGHECLFESDSIDNSRGSILILVLWILVIISFLASEYVSHNRHKATVVIHAMERFKRETIGLSILSLVASSKYDLLKSKSDIKNAENSEAIKDNGKPILSWMRLVVGQMEFYVRIEKESSKVRLSLDQENIIRSSLKTIYGEDREQDADNFADVLLDWLDPDDLVRLNGAEKEYYKDRYPACEPGNSPFKSMSQLFLLKDFDYGLFWGNPNKFEGDSTEPGAGSIFDKFTIYPDKCFRVSLFFPDADRLYGEIFFIAPHGNGFKIVEQLSRVFSLN